MFPPLEVPSDILLTVVTKKELRIEKTLNRYSSGIKSDSSISGRERLIKSIHFLSSMAPEGLRLCSHEPRLWTRPCSLRPYLNRTPQSSLQKPRDAAFGMKTMLIANIVLVPSNNAPVRHFTEGL
jgi:hypothetical protein